MSNHDKDEHRPYAHHTTTTEAERIAIAAAKVAVTDAMTEMWSAFGVNRANAESMDAFRRDQIYLRDMREAAEDDEEQKEKRRDDSFLRDLRKASDNAKSRMWLTIWTMIVAAGAIGLWQWFKAAVTHAKL